MSSKDTPMMIQYKEIKSRHLDCILFFRMGDFYEMFFDDAKTAARVLELTLTARGKHKDEPIPMCGIPHHAAPNYIPRLVRKGHKVAICEQIEDPAASKGITKRDVVKIVTPGTITELNMLESKHNNYLMAVYQEKDDIEQYGISYIDISTGDFYVSEVSSKNKLFDEISRINPSEVLMSKELSETIFPTVTIYEPDSIVKSEKKLTSHFSVNSLESFGCEKVKLAMPAAKAILDYVLRTQKTSVQHVNRLTPYLSGRYMFFDAATRRNLELSSTIRDKEKSGSLLWVLDKTKTAMGGRMLYSWMNSPLLDYKELSFRQESVKELYNSYSLRNDLLDCLKGVYDIERLTTRVVSATANPREIRSLVNSLTNIINAKSLIRDTKANILANILVDDDLNDAKNIIALVENAIVDDPPITLKDGGIIKEGYLPELDEIRNISKDGKSWIANLEMQEKETTGIKSLKVGYNKVFGYYIEVTKSNLSMVPEHYIRKQTLTNGERYITPELKEKESQILNASDRYIELEQKTFVQIRDDIAKYIRSLQRIARDVASLDVLLSFAQVAEENNYCCPEIYPMGENDAVLEIRDGRHPVIEKTIGQSQYVPNDVHLDFGDNRFIILTGPNMSGKSTYMRQTALIALMAQIGSFVPASSAKITMVDRIFTRVGAMDDIFSGQSTFMVEMNEASNILHNATKHSLIILDEIGRGTSTYDGISIAGAVAEHINMQIGAKTIFATHYHELTAMAGQYHGIKNASVAVDEEGDHVVFLHKVVDGAADKSYGIHVAELAGLPSSVLSRAKELLYGLEESSAQIGIKEENKEPTQMGLF